MAKHEKIDYLEFPVKDMAKTKAFFAEVFDWSFEDYGEQYTAFFGAGIDGGFFKSDKTVRADMGSVLMVFYSLDLQATLEKIVAFGGELLQPIFEFPGGRRFHFADPNGNEYAVWSDH